MINGVIVGIVLGASGCNAPQKLERLAHHIHRIVGFCGGPMVP
jgi:hypothetical protein